MGHRARSRLVVQPHAPAVGPRGRGQSNPELYAGERRGRLGLRYLAADPPPERPQRRAARRASLINPVCCPHCNRMFFEALKGDAEIRTICPRCHRLWVLRFQGGVVVAAVEEVSSVAAS
jgi:hypothetical protein